MEKTNTAMDPEKGGRVLSQTRLLSQMTILFERL